MNRRQITLAVATASLLVLIVLAFVLPVPYIVESPGPVFDTLGAVGSTQVLQITGAKTYSNGGHIYMTTVDEDPGDCGTHPTLATAVAAWFNSDDAVTPVQAFCPPDQTTSDVVLGDEADMAESQITAETAALTTLGYHVIGHEAIVAGVSPGTPAARYLKPEDIIRTFDGKAVTQPDQILDIEKGLKVGDEVHIVFTRSGRTLQATIPTVAAPTSNGGTDSSLPYIGIRVSPRPLFNGVTVDVGINPDQVGGPSAGTALALGIIDKLTPGGITGGRTIAGTGTITAAGKIGEIGGVQQKVAAAVKQGAQVFFSPAANCADAAAQAPSSLTLIKATTLSGVVQALKDIRNGSTDFPHC